MLYEYMRGEIEGIGLYIHIPFCATKCAYCDFNSYSTLGWLMEPYEKAVRCELERAFVSWQFTAETLYLGGGTPTVMPTESLVTIVALVRSHSEHLVEITVEANPGTVTLDQLRWLRKAGVNRISLGVQSMDDAELALLGRIHNCQMATESVELIRDAGFENLNIDLIFGLPGQSVESWIATLEKAVSLRPEHISAYALTLEPRTHLYDLIENGQVARVDEDLSAEMYTVTEEFLGEVGYEHYEISNWALPGRQCRHNLIYWYNRSYLGIGAGAWSHWQKRRWANIRDPREYVTRALNGESLVEQAECASRRQEISETLILGLRLMDGILKESFRQRFGVGLSELYGHEITYLVEIGLLEDTDGRIRLTKRGRLLGNEVFALFC